VARELGDGHCFINDLLEDVVGDNAELKEPAGID
jgi:hypothetical protein